jgi:hypothetical protein
MQRIVVFNYTNSHSVENRGMNDIKIGIKNRTCAANRAGGYKPGDLAIISTLDERIRWFYIAFITSENLGQTKLWSDMGGCSWSCSYSCMSLTRLFSTEEPAVIKILKEQYKMSRRDISDMFSCHPCAGGCNKSKYRDVVMSLLDLSKQEAKRASESMVRPKAQSPPPPASLAPPPTALTSLVQSQ